MNIKAITVEKWAVLNILTDRCCAIGDTQAECVAFMAAAFRHYPVGRVEALGFRIRRVLCTLDVLPPHATPPANQLPLFH